MRMCLACREMKPKKELIRIVLNKESGIALDFSGKAAGRGAYICKSKACFAKLKKSHGIEKNFGISVDDGIYANIEKELNTNE